MRLHSVRSMQQQRAAAVSQKFCQPVGTLVFTLEIRAILTLLEMEKRTFW